MAHRDMTESRAPGASIKPDSATTVYCKLFADRVTRHLCALRRQELNAKGGFSCEGCSMETEPAQQHEDAGNCLSSCVPKA